MRNADLLPTNRNPHSAIRNTMNVFIIAGEPSGDFHGARLAQALRVLAPGVTLRGVGGARMRDAGVELAMVSEHWGAIGIPESLRKAPAMYAHGYRLAAQLQVNPPDVLVTIDFGAFNVRLLKLLRKRGVPGKRVYYIPPGSWARDRKPGALPFLVDAIATPFPWSAHNLRAAGAPSRVVWVGHPVLDVAASCDRAAVRAALEIAPDTPVLALVPGSRLSEMRYLLPTFVETVRRLQPAPVCLVTVAPSLGRERLARLLPSDLPVRLLDGIDLTRLPIADAALVTSGTATLEVACAGVPMAVAYKTSPGTHLQVQLLVALGKAPKYFALPNILADAPVVPEFYQAAATPDALAAAVTPLLADTPARRAQTEAFAAIRHTLGDGRAVLRTAALVCEVAGVTPAETVPALVE
jgi:lipid-A-disaccharide synthase